jgi:hypothetical protein
VRIVGTEAAGVDDSGNTIDLPVISLYTSANLDPVLAKRPGRPVLFTDDPGEPLTVDCPTFPIAEDSIDISKSPY